MLQMGLRAQVEAVLARVAERRQVVLPYLSLSLPISPYLPLSRLAAAGGCPPSIL